LPPQHQERLFRPSKHFFSVERENNGQKYGHSLRNYHTQRFDPDPGPGDGHVVIRIPINPTNLSARPVDKGKDTVLEMTTLFRNASLASV